MKNRLMMATLPLVLSACAGADSYEHDDGSQSASVGQPDVEQIRQAAVATSPGDDVNHRVGVHFVSIRKSSSGSDPVSKSRVQEYLDLTNEMFRSARTQFYIDRFDSVVMPDFTESRSALEHEFRDVEAQLQQIADVAGEYSAGTSKSSAEWLKAVSNAHMPWSRGNLRQNVFIVDPHRNSANEPSGNFANSAQRAGNFMYLRSDVQTGSGNHNMAHEFGHAMNLIHIANGDSVARYPTPPVPGTPEYHPCNYWDSVYAKNGLTIGSDSAALLFPSRAQCDTYVDRTTSAVYRNLAMESSSQECSSDCIEDGVGCPSNACWYEADTSTNRLGMIVQGERFLAGQWDSNRRMYPLHNLSRSAGSKYAYNLMGYSPVSGWRDARFLSDSQTEIVRDTTFRHHHASQTSCFGKTDPGHTDWQQYDGGLYVDIDTTYCGLGMNREGVDSTGAPIYFATVGGDSSHWLTRGASSIYNASASGFRIYLAHSSATPESANSKKWHINWVGHDRKLKDVRGRKHLHDALCVGQTSTTSTDWKQYTSSGVYVDVDTSHCQLGSTPVYITSLGGNSGHWTTRGATSIYQATKDGFRVFIYESGITPEVANQRRWHLNWKAVPTAREDMGGCAGVSDENWKDYEADSVYIDVNTSECDHLHVGGVSPTYFTSLTGDGSHWQVYGATSVYAADAGSFRIFLQRSGLDADFAKANNWKVRWVLQP